MLVGHVFDFSIVLRSRRRELRMRQDDLADYAGVSRGFISDLEHGKPSVEFGKVLQVLAALNVPMSIGWCEDPPAWAKPFRKRALARERREAARRPRHFKAHPRPIPHGARQLSGPRAPRHQGLDRPAPQGRRAVDQGRGRTFYLRLL